MFVRLMFAEIEVDGISNLVVHLAKHCTVALAYNVPILRLWMEHYSSNRVLLAFYCHNELLSFKLICGKYVEEVV